MLNMTFAFRAPKVQTVDSSEGEEQGFVMRVIFGLATNREPPINHVASWTQDGIKDRPVPKLRSILIRCEEPAID